jgi:hypothetical protein
MPIPTSYSETDIAAYMLTALSNVAGVLGWDASTAEVDEAIVGTLLAYHGTAGANSTIANATDIMKLRVLARREIWRAAVAALSTKYTFSTDGQSFQRSDMMKFAASMLDKAETDAAAFDTSTALSVGVSTLRYPADPYVYLPDEMRIP